MNAQINNSRTVHCLPPELLAYIFQEVTADVRNPARAPLTQHLQAYRYHDAHSDSGIFRVDTRPIFLLASVCKRWREVLLAMPSMWTHLDAHRAEEFSVFLERARSLPLSLSLDVEGISISQPPYTGFRGYFVMRDAASSGANVAGSTDASDEDEDDELDVDDSEEDDDLQNDEEEDEEEDYDEEEDDEEEDETDEDEDDDSDDVINLNGNALRVRMAQLAIKKCSPNLRRLDIVVRSRDMLIPLWLHDPAPHIECLTVCLPELRRNSFTIPGQYDIFPNSEPSSLKALALSRVSFWLPRNHFPLLTHLYISFNIKFSIDDMLRMLEHVPNVSYLHIATALLHSTVLQPLLVKLDNLRSLAFTSCNCTTLGILPFLIFGPDVLIRCNDIAFTEEQHFTLMGNPTFCNFNELDIQSFGEVMHILLEGPMSGFWFQAYWDPDDHAGLQDWNMPLCGLHTRIPLTNITSLRIVIENTDPNPILEILEHTPRLVDLTIRIGLSWPSWDRHLSHGDFICLNLTRLCMALEKTPDVLCPELRSMTLRSNGASDMDLLRYRGIIERMLVTRKLTGNHLRELVIKPQGADPGVYTYTAVPTHPAQAIRDAFTGLEKHVETLRVLLPGEPTPDATIPFVWKEMWTEAVEEEERYWALDPDYRPRFEQGRKR